MSSIIYNGHEIQDLIINGNQAQLWLNGQKLYPSVEPGPSIDSVTIGSQTWMSKNLAIDDGQGGIYTQTVNYGQGNVTEYYYTWDAAVRVATTVQGWHLPSNDELGTLVNGIGSGNAGKILKSTYGWSSGNGTDDYGFSVFPAGYITGNQLTQFGTYSYIWCSNSYSSTNAYRRRFAATSTQVQESYSNKSYGYSVRLVKDAA